MKAEKSWWLQKLNRTNEIEESKYSIETIKHQQRGVYVCVCVATATQARFILFSVIFVQYTVSEGARAR